MAREISLFQKDEITFKQKFYILMDILITNQVESRAECFIFMGIFYLQILSAFFAPQLGVFDKENSTSDKILNYIQEIVRIKDLFKNRYHGFQTIIIVLLIYFILCILHFNLTTLRIRLDSFYSYNKIFMNYYIKTFCFICYNMILDLCWSSFCFGSDEFNPNFEGVTCKVGDHIPIVIISIIFILAALIGNIFIQIYYSDSFYLSNSYYAKMNCNYDLYWALNCLINSVLLTQAKYLSKEIFLIYNLIISIIFWIFYLTHYLYYDNMTNILAGIFHTLYAWSSIFFLIFAYIDFQEKGIIYLLTCIIVTCFYINMKNKIEAKIFMDTPFFKIKNKFYLLYYFRTLIDKINSVEENPEDKAFLSGIIEMHGVECPNPTCLLKTKDHIYLPIADKWSDRSKRQIDDDVFLKNFLIIVMNYFLYTHGCTVDMYLNLSLYYLRIIGNYCQAMYYYKKVTELKLTLQEEFTFARLNIQISRALVEKLKGSNESNVSLEHLNVSLYYKYDALSQNFVDEISNDVNLSLEFWKTFRGAIKEQNKKIDFNKVFELTDKIRITKANVERMWTQLLKIYGGVNNFFELYIDYVEQINDDDLKKRDLESLKRKSDNYSDHINNNFYGVLFNKDTGIIIANGDKGSEGIIELSNKEIENIFKYKPSDLKGMNLTHLMPKLFAKDHGKYMETYFKVGEKRLLDKTDFKTFGKDKNNSVVKIKLALKLFPILNENVFFVGMIMKENIDDIILLDQNFVIQGMSLKLMKILGIDNKFLFQENEIPFYVICKKFVNFYKVFFIGNKKSETPGSLEKSQNLIEEEKKVKEKEDNEGHDKKDEKEFAHENVEINENVELEYEIKIPQFLIDYSEKTNKKDAKLGLKLMSMGTESDNEGNDSMDEFGEEDLLVEDSKEKSDAEKEAKDNKQATPGETPGQGITPGGTPNGVSPGGETDQGAKESNNDINNNIKSGFNKQSEEEKLYKSKIKEYKTYFESVKLDELEALIDKCNNESSSNEYKFNFTFDRYKYGNKQIAYIVRCIDNKNEGGKSEEESMGELDPNAVKYKKEKSEAIKPLYELLEEEKKEILSLPEIFLKLSLENKKFQKLLQQCKNDITSMSKTHGQKKEEVIEDENSSQSSQASFDSGLVKKNRIEEIRSNLLKNISNFYTLKYLKLVVILLGLCTFIFCVLYLIVFWGNYNTLIDVSSLNISLFQTSLWTTELISVFLSMKTMLDLYIYRYNCKPDCSLNFTMNTYVGDGMEFDPIYYSNMINVSRKVYHNISDTMGILEMDISKYLNAEELENNFWERVNVSYYYTDYFNKNSAFRNKRGDNESYPMALEQVLSNGNYFVSHDIFNSTSENTIQHYKDAETNITSKELVDYKNYTTYIIIESGYDNILPNQFQKLQVIPNKLQDYNSKRRISVIIIIIVYAVIMIMCGCIYFFLIHLTNKSMTDGLEKVTKIRIEKIEETIKKIEVFNSNLKRFRDKDAKADEGNKESSEASENGSQDGPGQGQDKGNKTAKNNQNQQQQQSTSSSYSSEQKKFIPLNVLNYSFLHIVFIFSILLGFLIPTYIVSNQMVVSTNKLLLVQNYIFGKLISSSASTVEIKCFMSSCEHKTNLTYSTLVNMDLIQDVIKGINVFNDVSDFYNEKFLLNACAAAFDENADKERYDQCLEDSLIISANNTDNLIKLIEDIVDNIYKEYDMKSQSESNFPTKKLFESDNFKTMEKIFYSYIIPVGDKFAELSTNNLENYLKERRNLVVVLVIVLGVLMVLYCLVFGVLFIQQLIHYLSVSRCIMKIIPTTVIINTHELETWIENKY